MATSPRPKLGSKQPSQLGASAAHTISPTERNAYVDFLNNSLKHEPKLVTRMPIDAEKTFEALKDGIVLITLINKFFPDTIDISKLSMKPKNQFEMNINNDALIAGARQIGCSVVNIGAADISEMKEHLVMGLTWQTIKHSLMSQITKLDLSRLALETDEVISKVPPEQMIMRWFNYHLKNAGHNRLITNFQSDIQDSECYAFLLRQIAPDKITEQDLEAALREKDPLKRANIVLGFAERLNCRQFVTPQDIVDGNPRLNFAFVASLFQAFPSLGPTKEELALEKAGSLETKVKRLNIDLDNALFEKQEIESELFAARANYDELAMELKNLSMQVAESEAEKEELLKCKLEYEQKISELETRTHMLEDDLQRMTLEKGDLETSLREEAARRAEAEEMNKQLEMLMQEQEQEFAREKKRMETEFENARLAMEREAAALRQKLSAEIEEKERVQKELAAKTQEWALHRQEYENEIARLKARIAELEAENARLRELLSQESVRSADTAERLTQAEDELDRTIRESDDDKLNLLARIRQLEDELATLKGDAESKLRMAERDKQEALQRAAEQRQKELLEAELKRYRDLDKVRLLLTGNTKQGWLMMQTSGLLSGWKQRFFVLKDHLLYWYKDEASVTSTKPMGVVSCEDVRLYELDEKEIKRLHAFQLIIDAQAGSKAAAIKINLAAPKLEDLKDWMTEIRLAKKKKLGVDAASKETVDQRKAREANTRAGV